MTLAEEIIEHIQTLPEAVQSEVLDFVEFLEARVGNENVQEDREWATLSLSSALRDMEDEAPTYSMDDLKEAFA